MERFIKVVNLKPMEDFLGEPVFIKLKSQLGVGSFWFKVQGLQGEISISGFDSERMNRVIPMDDIEFIMPAPE